MKYYIYKTTNKATGRFYVGYHQSEDIEKDPYLGSGLRLRNEIKKYGEVSFNREILFEFDTEKEATTKEAELVNEDFLKDPNVLNLACGGRGGSSVAACLTSEQRKQNGKKAAKALSGRSKETHSYIKEAGIKASNTYKLKSEEEKDIIKQKSLKWREDKEKVESTSKKISLKNTGKNKENCEGKRIQSEKLSAHMNGWMAEHIAQQLRGRTKENNESRRRQAEKVSGENNSSKRPEVRAKLSKALSGEKNPMFGKVGELSKNSKLSDTQRLDIVLSYENGMTRKQLFDKYKDIVKPVTVGALLKEKKRALIKQRYLGK